MPIRKKIIGRIQIRFNKIALEYLDRTDNTRLKNSRLLYEIKANISKKKTVIK